jgi:hypothetical protein
LDDFGFYSILQEWAQKFVEPLAQILFPDFVGNERVLPVINLQVKNLTTIMHLS